MQRVLIPTDFSENAWNATAYAMRFFHAQKLTFHFLHIAVSLQTIEDSELHSAGLSAREGISKEIKLKMNDWVKKIKVNYPNPKHTFEQSILEAPFVEGVRVYLNKNDIQFIVMGTKGVSGLKEMTIGSKTGAIITRVKCPILVVPEKARFKEPLNIGFPTDFNLLYRDKIINTLREIAEMHNSAIKVLRVAQTQKPLDNFQNNNRTILKEYLSEIPHSFHVIEHPNLENALQLFISTMQIDMVAMIAKNLNFFERILFKPKVAKISYHVHIPFLVLHE